MNTTNVKKNIIWNLLKTISNVLFPLISVPYISRVLLPENVGKVNFSVSFVSYFSLIASLGISAYAIRECAAIRENKLELRKKASQFYSINICTTVLAYVLMAIILLSFNKLDSYRELIIIQSATIFFATIGADWLNSAMEDFSYIAIRTICLQIISIILMFMFIKNTDDYIKYALILVIASSGANIFNYFYRKKFCKLSFTIEINWKEHMRPIIYMLVMLLAQTIFNSADITMLGIMKGDYEVGLYSTAVKISNLVSQIVSSIVWVMMPSMSKLFSEKDYDQINFMLRKVLGIFLLLGIPSGIGVIVLSKEIIYVIAGEAFANASYSLSILMISFLFSIVGGSFLGNMVFLPAKQEKKYMIICCAATIINVIANYFVIPYWGAIAASGTTAISSLVITILLFIFVDKRIKINGIKSLVISPIIGTIVIVLFCGLIGSRVDSYVGKIAIDIIGSVVFYTLIQFKLKNQFIIELFDIVKNKVKNVAG